MSQRASVAAIVTALAILMPSSVMAQAPFAVTWGTEGSGELGNGLPPTGLGFPGPVMDTGGSCCFDQMVDIQGSNGHSLALDGAARVFTWGDNSAGQLGLGTLAVPNSSIPVQVPGLSGELPAAPEQETIAAEGGHNLVVDSSGGVWAWGINHHGQLGIGTPGPATCGTAPSLYPCVASPLQLALNNVSGVGAGEVHSLAVVGDCTSGPGDAYGWGSNFTGQLGDNTTTDRFTPVQVHGPLDVGFLTGVAKLVGGSGHTVALMCNGEILAWGQNNRGQLGNGNTTNGLVPAPVVTQCPLPPRPLLGCPLTNVIDIAAGFQHSIAVDVNGDVWFWGDNAFGQLCDGTTNDHVFATKVLSGAATGAPAGSPLDVVAAGAGFSLVVLAQGTAVACGQNSNGQLGDCTTTGTSVPVPVHQPPSCSAPVLSVRLVEAGEDNGLMLVDRLPNTATPTGTATPTPTATRAQTPTATASPTLSRTPTRSATPTSTLTHTTTPSFTSSPSRTPTRTPSSTPTVCVMPPADMVGWWTADNTTSDISGNANHGALQGAATYGAGVVSDAFLLGAFPDFVEVPDHPSLNFGGNLSIDAWISSTNTTTAAIVDKRTGTAANPVGYHLFLFGGRLGFQLGDGLPFSNHTTTTTPINDGGWHHVAVTIDRMSAAGGSLYIDGTLVHTFDPTTRPGSISNTAPPRIGQRFLSPAQGFAGAIDEVEFFDRVLGPQEIQDIFHAGAGGKCKWTPTATPTFTPTRTPTATLTASFTSPPVPCAGDCDGNGEVTVDELVTGVNIALGATEPDACLAFDPGNDGAVTVDELVVAVNNALQGCG